MINRVELTRRAEHDLEKAPEHIVAKFATWLDSVETIGLEETRKRPGWHDKPLHGDRKGQRSVRLSKKWRAIYEIKSDGSAKFVEVQEVTPHAY
jgi:proteic killer suppression protein